MTPIPPWTVVFYGVLYGTFISVMIMGIASPVTFTLVKLFCCFWLLLLGVLIGGNKTMNTIFERMVMNE